MGFWDDKIAPALVACACSTRPILKTRRQIVPQASGAVLELGMGAGANLAYYDRARVAGISAVEPSSAMRERTLKVAAAAGLEVDLRDGVGEALPFADQSFDCVVCTYTLCSVQDVAQTLTEARRVLKPGGRFLFGEHGLAPDPGPAAWQRRLEPLWKPLAGGCHLTRDPVAQIKAAGFTLSDLACAYLPKTPKPLGWVSRGFGV